MTTAATDMATALSRLPRILLLAVSASSIAQASNFLPRQAPPCGGIENIQQCGSGFPSSFCCPKDTRCIALNGDSVQSVICCPSTSDCAFIQTVTCDITQLNATLHPDNQIHISETDGIQLPQCGDKCCPLGYTCKGSMCSKDSTSSSAAATPSPTRPLASSRTSEMSNTAPLTTSRSANGRFFAAGFFPGLVIGVVGTISLVWLVGRRRKRRTKEDERLGGPGIGYTPCQISGPILDPSCPARTDFIRRGSQSTHSSPNSADRIMEGMRPTNHGSTPRIRSMWDRTPKLNFGFATSLSSHAVPAPPAVRAGDNHLDPYTTPPPKHGSRRKHSKRKHRRDPDGTHSARNGNSQETIDVLMPAPAFLAPPKISGMRQNRLTSDSSNTTFTKLMERAGFDDEGLREVRDWKSPNR